MTFARGAEGPQTMPSGRNRRFYIMHTNDIINSSIVRLFIISIIIIISSSSSSSCTIIISITIMITIVVNVRFAKEGV